MIDRLADIRSQLLDMGLELESDEPRLNTDRVQRTRVKGRKSHQWDGAYSLSEFRLNSGEVVIVGWAQAWNTGEVRRFTLKDGAAARLGADEREALKRKMEEADARKRKEAEARAAEAARAAEEIWAGLSEEGGSQYLQDKRVMAWGVRFVTHALVVRQHDDPFRLEVIAGTEPVRAFFEHLKTLEKDSVRFGYHKAGTLVVPVRNMSGALTGLQFIRANGGKKFLPGTAKRGCSGLVTNLPRPPVGGLLIDPPPPWIAFAEGYATAASAYQAKLREAGVPVVVTFDAGNIGPVAEHFRAAFPDTPFLFLADDDYLTKDKPGVPDNPGVTFARAAAQRCGGVVAIPDFSGVEGRGPKDSDFNDVQRLAGVDAVRHQVTIALDSFAQRSFESGEGEGEVSRETQKGEWLGGVPLEVYEKEFPDPDAWAWMDRELSRTDKGAIIASMANVASILTYDPAWRGVLSFCEFSYRIMKLRAPPWSARGEGVGEWTDGDTARLHIWLTREYGVRATDRDMQGAVTVVAEAQPHHPVRRYLRSLRWDGVPRVAGWLSRAGDAAGKPFYLAAIGTRFLVGAIRRVMEPGIKHDSVLILEGIQGAKKSSALEVLAGEWFSDAKLDLSDKDGKLALQGVWIHEMGELDSMDRATINAAKLFFSTRVDRFRRPFGKVVEGFPRQCCHAGSTNESEYLRDFSGNRRYWVVEFLRRVDLAWLVEVRDQLWAEAFQMHLDGVPHWIDEDDSELAREVALQQESRVIVDPWEYRIRDWIAKLPRDYFTAEEVLEEVIQLDPAHQQQHHTQRIGRLMKRVGVKKSRKRLPGPEGKTQFRQVYRVPTKGGDPFDGDE